MQEPSSTEKILIIDDEPMIRELFSIYLEEKGYNVVSADNGRTGLEMIESENPALVLTDLNMPHTDGYDVMKQAHEKDEDLPIVVISGAGTLDAAVKALRQGAWDYLIKPLQDMSILQHTIEKSLEKSRLLKENRRYRVHLEELVQERTQQLELRNKQLDISRRQIIGILSQAAEYKDFETGDHFLRVSEYCACIAEGMGWTEEMINHIKLASPVHDIGKIGIPDHILLKEGKLTPEEWEVMKNHTQYGNNILKSDKFVSFYIKNQSENGESLEEFGHQLIETAANIALNHHERWDGSGYPLGLKGEEIPIEARITAVADVYDALRSHRPYKEPWPHEKCLNYIESEADKHFDPQVVRVFLENIETIQEIRNTYAD